MAHPTSMTIPDKELAALHNLADKQAGRDVAWINIADAQALTDLTAISNDRSAGAAAAPRE
jgi:hypothetical protein